MVSDEALKKLQEQIAAWPMTQRFVVQQLIEDYRMDREDLRAYKATGLTPEEVERSKLEIEAGCVKAIARTYGVDINRLRKLAEADRDGRLVVLPCKVGDTVYMIERIFDIDNGVCDEICARKVIGYGGNKLNKLWLIGSGGICNVSIFVSEFGKPVFLTREEAEKALEAMKNV